MYYCLDMFYIFFYDQCMQHIKIANKYDMSNSLIFSKPKTLAEKWSENRGPNPSDRVFFSLWKTIAI